MSKTVSIRLSVGRKAKISLDAYNAAKRAIPLWESDERVARYAAAPHEGVTAEVVASIRRTMVRRGEVRATSFCQRPSRRQSRGT